LEDCLLCLIPKDLIEQLINLYPDVAREFIKLLSNNIREKEDQLLQLAYQSVRKKMAAALLRLFSLQTDKNPNIRISREDLAAMAGMATETVSRTLSDFKEEGLIEKKASTITLLDPVSLGKMKN
jgi:CRP-like cAMP-binding protein